MSDLSWFSAGAFLALASGPCTAATLIATPIAVTRDFQGDEADKPAKELSGIACAAPVRQERQCLLIDDELPSAQYATLGRVGLGAGALLPLTVGGLPAAVGSAPIPSANVTVGEATSFDGEAVAYDGTNYYIVGSAGLSRKKEKFQQASFLIARFGPSGSTFSYRLADALRTADGVSGYFLKPLNGADGANIEALAVSGDHLIVGLRAPNLGGDGLLVIASVADVFAKGTQPLSSAVKVERIELGSKMGIRDLAMLPSGQLLVLAGPMLDAPTKAGGYRLLAHDRATSTTAELGTLPDFKDKDGLFAKAEGVAVLGQRGKEVDLLLIYDGLPNGEPQKVTVILP